MAAAAFWSYSAGWRGRFCFGDRSCDATQAFATEIMPLNLGELVGLVLGRIIGGVRGVDAIPVFVVVLDPRDHRRQCAEFAEVCEHVGLTAVFALTRSVRNPSRLGRFIAWMLFQNHITTFTTCTQCAGSSAGGRGSRSIPAELPVFRTYTAAFIDLLAWRPCSGKAGGSHTVSHSRSRCTHRDPATHHQSFRVCAVRLNRSADRSTSSECLRKTLGSRLPPEHAEPVGTRDAGEVEPSARGLAQPGTTR